MKWPVLGKFQSIGTLDNHPYGTLEPENRWFGGATLRIVSWRTDFWPVTNIARWHSPPLLSHIHSKLDAATWSGTHARIRTCSPVAASSVRYPLEYYNYLTHVDAVLKLMCRVRSPLTCPSLTEPFKICCFGTAFHAASCIPAVKWESVGRKSPG